MKKIILALASLTVLVGQAFAAGVLINGSQINPQTAISISTLTVTGATGLTATSNITGPGTGLTGTAASLTAGHVTTNANLTGDVTSVGNATTAAATQANITALSNAAGVNIAHGVSAASGTFTNGITASSGTFTGNAFSVGGSTFVVIGGNVGIGTTNPAFPLDIKLATNLHIETLTSGGTTFLDALNDAGGAFVPMSINAMNLSLNSSVGGNILLVNDGGNVGIGTTSPATTLDVDGDITMETGTAGAVLCLTAAHALGHCTSAASCTGTCTCTCAAN